MRRLAFMCVLVGVLAGCSSGSSDVASSKPSTTTTGSSSASPTGTSSTSAKAKSSPTTTKSAKAKATGAPPKAVIGGAKNFCGAFKELRTATASSGAATASAVYIAAAQDMRKYAPASIKSAANAYADVIEEAGKALKASTMPTTPVGKPANLATVTVWVSKNCPKK